LRDVTRIEVSVRVAAGDDSKIDLLPERKRRKQTQEDEANSGRSHEFDIGPRHPPSFNNF
jgi:hypothetical protein